MIPGLDREARVQRRLVRGIYTLFLPQLGEPDNLAARAPQKTPPRFIVSAPGNHSYLLVCVSLNMVYILVKPRGEKDENQWRASTRSLRTA